MRLDFRVVYTEGQQPFPEAGQPVEVLTHTKPKDIVAFERQFDLPSSKLANKAELRFDWIYYLAWVSLFNRKAEPRGYDEFLSAVEVIDMIDDEEDESKEEETEQVLPFEQTPSVTPSPS